MLTLWMLLLVASPVSAQDVEAEPGVAVVADGDEAAPESEVIRDDETSDTIQGIRQQLIVIAGGATIALLVYVWHTSPGRRYRIAAERLQVHGPEKEPDEA